MSGLQLIATGGAIPGRTVTNEDPAAWWIPATSGSPAAPASAPGTGARRMNLPPRWPFPPQSRLWPAAALPRRTLPAVSAPPFRPGCHPQRGLSGTGGAGPARKPARAGHQRGLFRFLYGMAVARGMLTTLGGQYALVIGCEALSRLMDPTDRSTCVLFGDGAGAAIFQLADTPFALTLGRARQRCSPCGRAEPHRFCAHHHGRQGRIPLCSGCPAQVPAHCAG